MADFDDLGILLRGVKERGLNCMSIFDVDANKAD